MAKSTGLGQNFYLGGHDLSGDVGSLENVSTPMTTLDATGIDKSAMERIAGTHSGEISFSTYFNDAALQEHIALKGLPTTDVLASYTMGTALGDTSAHIVAKQINYDWTRGADGSLMGTVQLLSNSVGLEWGELVTAGKITLSSAGSTVGSVAGAGTSNGCAAVLHVFSLSSGTPTFKVQHSSDTSNGSDGSWSDLITFTIQAQGVERLSASGTCSKGLRITSTGTFSNAVIAVTLRRGESTDVEGY